MISAALSRDYLFEGRLEAKDVQGQLDAAVLKACFQPEQPAERPYLESLITLKETLKARGRAGAPDPRNDIEYSIHFEGQRRNLPSRMRAGATVLAEELKAGKVPAFVYTRLAEVLEQRGSHQLLKAWPQIAAAAPGARQAFWQLEVEPYLSNPAELQQRLSQPTPPSPLLEVARQLKLDERWEGNPEVVRSVLDSYQSSMAAGFAPALVVERLQAQLERLESHGNTAQTAANIVRDTNSFLLTQDRPTPQVTIVESEKSVSIGGISIPKKKPKALNPG